MTRRRTFVLGGGAALTLALTSCGRPKAEAPSATRGTAVDDQPATGTIDVWAMGTEGELLSDFVSAFEEKNPDAVVKVTAIPWQDYTKKIETAIASGSTPDMTMVGSSEVASIAVTNGFEPVPEGVADPTSFFSSAQQGTTLADTSYAVPWYVETRVLFYRRDLADAAGLVAPTTWDEFLTFARGLQSQGAEWGLHAPYSWNNVAPYLWQAGSEFTTQDLDEFTFDTPETVEGFTYYHRLFADGIANPSAADTLGDVEPLFVSGKVGSFLAGPWEIGLLKDAGGEGFMDQVGIVTVPAGPKSNTSYVGGSDLSVFKDAKNRDGAWKLVRWLSGADVQADWFKVSGDLPAVQSAWNAEALTSNAQLAVFQQQLSSAQNAPALPTWNQVASLLEDEIEKVAKGVTTPEDAASDIQADATKIGTGR